MPPTRKSMRFDYSGVSLNAAVDNLPPNRCPICENWHQEQDGTLTPRPGLGTGSGTIAGQTNLHSVRRLDDTSSGSKVSALIIGAGTHIGVVGTDLSAATDKDSGYSGDPLSIVIHRPTQSTKKFAYIADRSRMKKIDQAGNIKPIGLATPRNPPTAVLADAPSYKAVDEFNNAASWAQGGTAAAPANNTRVDAATRSITAIAYDSGVTGWACVRPSTMTDIGQGMRLTFNPATTNETATVEEVHKGSAASAFVVLTTGNTGEYSIHPTTPIDVEVNSLVSFSGTGEYARVRSVYETPTGTKSFIIGGVLLTPSGNVQAWASFRVYLASTHAGASPLSSAAVQFAVTTGVGYLTQIVAIDLSLIASGVQTLPDDRVHLSLFVDRPDLVSEIKAYWDVDVNTAAAADVGTRNYMQKILRSNDIVNVTRDTQTLINNKQVTGQRDIIENQTTEGDRPPLPAGPGFDEPPIDDSPPPDPNSPNRNNQIDAGANQYTEAFWRISEMLEPDIGRIGADGSRGLANVVALKIAVICTGNVTVRLDSFWIGGGYGPDITEGRPVVYRYRYRDSTTGVVSNWSPPSLGPATPRRQKVTVTAFNSGDANVDLVDIFRYGGVLLGWHFAGSTLHSSLVFSDTYPDSDLDARGALSDQQAEDYQLWPLHSIPVTGTCTVVGSVVTPIPAISADIAPGSRIRIGQEWHIIQYVKSGGATLFLTDSAGSATVGTAFEIPDPVLVSQVLPVLCGPFFGFFFGLGDKVNPQRLYYANGNNCDSTREDQFIDVESETLQNMVGGEDWAILFTTQGIYSVEPSFSLAATGGNLFRTRKIPGSIGLFARWACCACDTGAAFLGKDGVYYTGGGAPEMLTEDLRPIFPHAGSLGVVTNGFYPPNMVAAQKNSMRLSYADNELFFDYVDTNSSLRTIVRRFKPNSKPFGWRPYSYSTGAAIHHDEEGEDVHSVLVGGAVDGKLYRLGRNQADAAGANIVAPLQTHSDDIGEPVARKRFNGVWLDYDTNAATINVTPGFDNNGVTLAPTAIADAAGRKQKFIAFNTGDGQYGRNISLGISVTVTTLRPILHLWEPVYESAADPPLEQVATEVIDLGGVRFVQGVTFDVDTGNSNVDVNVKVDQDALQTVISNGNNSGPLLSNGRAQLPISFKVPFLTHLIRFVPLAAWRLYGRPVVHFRPDSELAYMWKSQQTACGMPGFKFFGDGYISVRSTENFRFFIIADGVSYEVTFYDANRNTAGERRRFWYRAPAFKAKSVEFQAFTNTEAGRVAIYESDFMQEVKPWSHEGGWLSINPLGGDHHDRGAPI